LDLGVPEPSTTPRFGFDNSYARLPPRFFARLPPTPVAAPRLIRLNLPLAEALALDPEALAAPAGVAVLAGNRVPPEAEPLAMAYAGHQFGHFVPQLGDGRAILLGEVIGRDGQRRDIQLKGAGPTPFSRNGDGRAGLGPVLREYVVSEAMAALGVPTTRSLAAVATGEWVFRETALPGGVLTRIAASHIRVGTFQYFAARADLDGVRLLADHAIARHDPGAASAGNPYRAFLEGVVARQADLIAQWLLFGFIHGVMNTDNCAISGETIDYGPCAFLDAYDPAKVFSSIDRAGRYAYGNQPRIAQWNLARLAETLLPLLDTEEAAAVAAAEAALGAFAPRYQAAYRGGLRRKLGLLREREGDDALAQDLLDRMAEAGADFTLTFRGLSDPANGIAARAQFADPAVFDDWLARWRQRLAAGDSAPDAVAAAMRSANPAVIPRNHRIEAAIEAAVARDDFAPFHALVEAVTRPFVEDFGFMQAPAPAERVARTFCGT